MNCITLIVFLDWSSLNNFYSSSSSIVVKGGSVSVLQKLEMDSISFTAVGMCSCFFYVHWEELDL